MNNLDNIHDNMLINQYRERNNILRRSLQNTRRRLQRCEDNLNRARNPTAGTGSTQSGGKRKKKSRKMKGGHHLYKRLGVSKYASQKQIRKAYNKLKKKKRVTSKIRHAYNILSKKKSRRKYNLRYKMRKH